MTKLKEKTFHDVKKALFLENKAIDIILKYSSKHKRLTVQLNNNDPFHIYYKKYKTREIMRDELGTTNTNWFKYVVKKIKKEINKRSYKESYMIFLSEGYNINDLYTTNIDIHVKDVLELRKHIVHAYLTNKDIVKLKDKNANKIEKYRTDYYVTTPEQNFYPLWTSLLPNIIDPILDANPLRRLIPRCRGSEYLRDVGWFNSSRSTLTPFPLAEEVNGNYNPNVVYMFIFDTGITRHNFLNINERRSRNFVPNNNNVIVETDWIDRHGHGNHVAGIAARRRTPVPPQTILERRLNPGVAGVATGNQVIGYKVLGDNGIGQGSWINNGCRAVINFSQQHPDALIVVNMSLGGQGGEGQLMNNSSYILNYQRIPVVVASGNNNVNTGVNNIQPANTPGSIVVGNAERIFRRWPESNYGARVDIFAPGVHIPSTDVPRFAGDPTSIFRCRTGTSMAAPVVAGAIALLLANRRNRGLPRLSSRQILNQLLADSRSLQCAFTGRIQTRENNVTWDIDCRNPPNPPGTTNRILYIGHPDRY
jgi:hypothetical protein